MSIGKHLMEQRFVLAAVLLALSFGTALAQNGAAQLRAACGRDFAAFCSGVQPGSGRGIECLRGNMPRLSPSCQQAMTVIGGPPPVPVAVMPAAPPPVVVGPTPVQVAILACDRDRRKLCNVVPGDGNVVACLAQAIRHVSVRCRDALLMLPR